MSQIDWKSVDADDEEMVGLSFPCHGDYGWRRHSDPCSAADRDHAHLHLTDDSLVGRVPFCCRSQEGLLKLVEELVARKTMSRALADLVPTLDAFQRLPKEMTAEEAKILSDPLELKRQTHYWYMGS